MIVPLWLKNVTVWFYLLDTVVSSQWTLHHFGVRFAPYCRVILLACSYRGLWEILSVIIAIVPEVFDLGVIILLFLSLSASDYTSWVRARLPPAWCTGISALREEGG